MLFFCDTVKFEYIAKSIVKSFFSLVITICIEINSRPFSQFVLYISNKHSITAIESSLDACAQTGIKNSSLMSSSATHLPYYIIIILLYYYYVLCVFWFFYFIHLSNDSF